MPAIKRYTNHIAYLLPSKTICRRKNYYPISKLKNSGFPASKARATIMVNQTVTREKRNSRHARCSLTELPGKT